MINFKPPLNEPGGRPAAWFITPLSLPASLTTVYQCDGISYCKCKNKTLFWQDTVTSRFSDDSLSRYKHMQRWFSLSVCLSVCPSLSLSLSLSLCLSLFAVVVGMLCSQLSRLSEWTLRCLSGWGVSCGLSMQECLCVAHSCTTLG